jgi:DNA-directed RNA polymerase subunit K/omega
VATAAAEQIAYYALSIVSPRNRVDKLVTAARMP